MNTEVSIDALIGLQWELYIGGQIVTPVANDYFDVISPANGEKIARVARGSAGDVAVAAERAHEAFLSWREKTAYEREAVIRKATAFVRTQADRIGMLMALEQGKPFTQSRSEIIGSCDTLDYYAAEGVRLEGYSSPAEKGNLRSWVIYQPVGVCGFITPWNYPVSLLSWKLGPALAAGCATVVKPTDVTPLSPLAFCMALTEGGIPPGVINVVTGDGVAGEALVSHPLVKKIAMTGSTATGKKILQAAAPYLKKVTLELGGQCPAIVCDDADLDHAAKVIAYKGFRNDGQSCSSVNRVYVHASVHEAFVAHLKKYAEKMSIGDGVSQTEVDLGPMCTREGVERVRQHVADALQKGAVLVTGGQSPEGPAFKKGNYYLPTILDQATDDMLVMQQETFGPVVPVQTFDDPAKAIEKANASSYGLVSYLFTASMKNTVRFSEALEAGTVAVNSSAVNTNYAPYAGWKESGYGLELSRRAIFEYVNTKHIKLELH